MKPTCEQCHGTGYRVTAAGELAKAEVCPCRRQCATCGGERFVVVRTDGYDVAQPCACAKLVERVRLFNQAAIPAGYALKRTSNFVHADRETSLAQAKQRFMRYEKAVNVQTSRGIVLVGPPGVGKTHLICALLNYATLQKGIACRFVDFFELTARIRATFDERRGGESEASIIGPLVDVPVLAIDDLGKGRGTNWELTIIDQLITRRYNAGRIVLATSNFLPEVQGKGGQAALHRAPRHQRETLDERIGDRLMSRLVEMADIVTLSGRDRRRSTGSAPSRR